MRLASRSAGRVVLSAVVLVLILAPSVTVALTLPDPPAPGTMFNGPIPGPKSSFDGGVILKQVRQTLNTTALNDPVATFECVAATETVAKTVKSESGMSMQGPISDAQTQGIIEAFNSVRPPKEVKLTTVVTGTVTTIDTWTLTGINYQDTKYEVYVITQAAPAIERLVGYVVIAVPTSLTTKHDVQPCPDPAPNSMIILGQDFHVDPPPSNPIQSFFDVFYQITVLPDDGIQPFFQYGKVNVYSNGGIAGTADVRPGETIQMELPPGSYDVQADVGIFGYHFSVDGGTFTSQDPVILSVTLSVEAIIYTIIIVIIAVCVLAAFLVVRHFVGGRGGGPSEGEGGPTTQPEGGSTSPPTGGETPAPNDGAAEESM